jgi:iron(III) transport system ATP-binding protein
VTALTIRGVAKSYAREPVLRHVDLDVPAGVLTAVLGPSGCGKTTLLRVIAGFTAPDKGTVAIDGRIVCDRRINVPAEHRQVGYVAQDGALFPHLPVAANIGFGLSRRQRRGARVAAMLELIGLPAGHARRYPHELSGGEQQRVALARALAPKPAVILLDEPFTSLDASLRSETRRVVAQALATSGITGLMVTHDQSEALSLASQVAVLRDGVIVQAADPMTLYQAPADPALAGFVGDAVLLDAEVSDSVAYCRLGQLTVRPVPEPPDGHAVVMIRPEQVRWQYASGGNGDLTAVPVHAQVAEVSYQGHDAMVSLVLETGTAGPPMTISLRTRGYEIPSSGERVLLSVDGPVVAYPAVTRLPPCKRSSSRSSLRPWRILMAPPGAVSRQSDRGSGRCPRGWTV